MRNLNKVDEVVADESELAKDTAIAKEYQSFSAELLRLALLGITGYGFLISTMMKKGDGDSLHAALLNDAAWAKWGVVCFGLAALAALVHRYCSSDSITHMVRRCRLKRKLLELRKQEQQATSGSIPDLRFADEDARVEGKGDGMNWNKLTSAEKKEQILFFIKDERISLYRDLSICKIALTASGLLLGAGAMITAGLFSRALLP